MNVQVLSLRRSAPRLPSLVLFIVACQLVGILGAVGTTTGASSWYQSLAKPGFQPPSWVFGPVWTALYAAMGYAAWRVWWAPVSTDLKKTALGLFAVQLALNGLWTPVFFGAQQPGLALIVLVALWFTVDATIRAFRAVDRTAALWLLPYLLWISFATVLNLSILRLN